MNLFLIALGGASGAILRYLVSQFMVRFFASTFPLQTLFVNVSGSLLLGLSAKTIAENHVLGLFFGVGFLGAYTTFSTFSFESIALLKQGKMQFFLLNTFCNVILSFGALSLGLWMRNAWK